MSSFFRIARFDVLAEELGGDLPENARRVFYSLFESGFFHTLDEFRCFKAFDSSRIEFRIHSLFSTEHHCSVCGSIQPGNTGHKCRVVGCGGILAPTSRAEPSGDPSEAPCGGEEYRLDISMHKSER